MTESVSINDNGGKGAARFENGREGEHVEVRIVELEHASQQVEGEERGTIAKKDSEGKKAKKKKKKARKKRK